MDTVLEKVRGNGWGGFESTPNNGPRISITTKLVLSFLLVIVVASVFFTGIGTVIINDHIRSDVQKQVRADVDGARKIYLDNLGRIKDIVVSAADRSSIQDAMLSGDFGPAADELARIRARESLDMLTITDEAGTVLFRARNPDLVGDDISHDELVQAVKLWQLPAAATTVISASDLSKEFPIDTDTATAGFMASADATAGPLPGSVDGLMLAAAAPIFNAQNRLIGVVHGGVLLNKSFDFICTIKKSVYHAPPYGGKEIGFVAIYQDDMGILSCPLIEEGLGAPGSQISEEIFARAVNEGQRTISRDVVLDSWYTSVYEPIWNANFHVVGVLHVGRLEQPYLDIRNQIIMAFMAITLIGAFVSVLFSYFISQRILIPLKKLVAASRSLAQGNLDARVQIRSRSNDELAELGASFNAMAAALKERDERIKEFTRTRISRSERLALIGQLSANVAHELNNPLQGIVTYSHLLLERMPGENSYADSVRKIVVQADRCRQIIRGLLDFARQREPVKTLCSVNDVLQDCISLLEDQALFHNIQIDKDFEADLPLAVIDASQIERVFINMIINAAEAMDGRGCLRLATRADTVGQSIDVIFADSGHGIAEENLGQIFDPFFTTKEVGHGTGLGLAISYGIVKEHGGSISVESAIDKGTTFTVRLPLRVEESVLRNEG